MINLIIGEFSSALSGIHEESRAIIAVSITFAVFVVMTCAIMIIIIIIFLKKKRAMPQ